MIYLAILCGALVLLVAWERRQNGAREAEREKAWSLERSALITRIQHPEFVVSSPDRPVVPDSEHLREEPDEIEHVGAIFNGDGNGD